MQAEAFRQFLRTTITNPRTQRPLTERTIERYVGDIVVIETRYGQDLDTLSLDSLDNLVEANLSQFMGDLGNKSIDNYRSPARHYVRFRQQQ